MKKAIYVTNLSVNDAFRFAHPRWHSEPITLYVFDYCYNGSGRILIYNNWQGGKPPKPSHTKMLSTFGTLADLYNTVIAIGKSEPETIAELHFFTHGDPSCGVVVMPKGEGTKTEFNRVLGKNTARGEAFALAFCSGALIKLWGCAGVDEAKRLTLGYWKTQSIARRRRIQQSVEKYIRGMYAWRLSFLLDQTVWTTPPGWSSAMDLPPGAQYYDYWDDDSGPVPGSRWWRVSPAFCTGPGAEFYREVLKAKIDPVGYVGVNDAMSQAPEPAEFIKAEAEINGMQEYDVAYPA